MSGVRNKATSRTANKKSRAAVIESPTPPAVPGGVTPDLIRRRAYEIYRKRNGGPGNPVSDWAQAERELVGAPRAVPFVVPFRKYGRADNHAPMPDQPFRIGVLYG